jgi:hypothetical protein
MDEENKDLTAKTAEKPEAWFDNLKHDDLFQLHNIPNLHVDGLF